MIIVEYCEFGSLYDFLIAHRAFFINQIQLIEGREIVDPSIQTRQNPDEIIQPTENNQLADNRLYEKHFSILKLN